MIAQKKNNLEGKEPIKLAFNCTKIGQQIVADDCKASDFAKADEVSKIRSLDKCSGTEHYSGL